jgi:copper homeostasis protein (lipoprotein)
VELDGRPLMPRETQRSPYLRLDLAAGTATGYSGCNRLTGSFLLKDDQLRFERIAMTRMACPESMQLEQDFLGMLDATRSYRISGSQLYLYGEKGVLAGFRAGGPG